MSSQPSPESKSLDEGGRGITQGMISRGTSIISSNVITGVLTDSSKMVLKSDLFPLNPPKSQTLVIASQNEPFLSCNRNVRASSEIGNSRIDHGRIGTPVMKKNWSVYDNFSVRSDRGEADKLDTSVQQYLTNESNTASLQIEEESLKSVFYKIVEESNSSERMNLTNSAIIEPPKIVSFRHPPMETDNVGNRLDGIVTNKNRTLGQDLEAHGQGK